MPYTAIDEKARTKRKPIGGSASWNSVLCPNIEMTPSFPFEKSPPTGITANTMKAGTNERNGASLKTARSARSGVRSSLKKTLMPSARLCRIPQGPARVGPRRFCMSPMILRSNQIISIVATSRNTNVITTLSSTIRTTARSIVAGQKGIGGEHHDRVSTRTSVTVTVASMSMAGEGSPRLNKREAVPRTNDGSVTAIITSEARDEVTDTDAPSDRPSRLRSYGLTRSTGPEVRWAIEAACWASVPRSYNLRSAMSRRE